MTLKLKVILNSGNVKFVLNKNLKIYFDLLISDFSVLNWFFLKFLMNLKRECSNSKYLYATSA